MSQVILVVDVEDADLETVLLRLEQSMSSYSLMSFLKHDVAPFMSNEIVQRFAYQGDGPSGDWPELSDTTIRIKRELDWLAGEPEDANIRTGQMFAALTDEDSYDYVMSGVGFASMKLPGGVDSLTAEKIRTAQEGKSSNPRPGYGPTPPRPVLATSPTYLAVILEQLEMHIIRTMAGSVLV